MLKPAGPSSSGLLALQVFAPRVGVVDDVIAVVAVKLQGAVVLQAGVDGGVTVADTVHVCGGPVPIGGVRAPCLTMRHRHRVRQKCQSSSAASIIAHAYFPIPLARLVRSSIVI